MEKRKSWKVMVAQKLQSKIEKEKWGWPPSCWGDFYQPKRPEKGNLKRN